MNTQNTSKKLSLPIVPVSFIAFVIMCALLYWWLRPVGSGGKPGGSAGPIGPGVFHPYQIPGGALHTSGFTKTEVLTKVTGSWFGTTSSVMSMDATYRYQIVLRSNWKFFVDETRKVAFVLAPPYQPQIPVAVDSKTVRESISSGWGRFDKWDQLQELRQEVSPFLEAKAKSSDYMTHARGEVRKTVEQFVGDWLLKQKGWDSTDQQFVKVYFADEPDIPFPTGTKLKDFIPQ